MIRIPLKKGCKLIYRIKGNKELETRVLRRGRKCLSFFVCHVEMSEIVYRWKILWFWR